MLDYLKHLYYSIYAILVRRCIVIDVQAQRLIIYQSGLRPISFSVSTSRYGTGETEGSYQTPRGWFYISDCIGEGMSLDTVFKGRKPIGRLGLLEREEDPILARIIRLSGLQHLNRNTYQRYIYIHGTPDGTFGDGEHTSIGCVRMSPSDVSTLFDLVRSGMLVCIFDPVNPLKFQPQLLMRTLNK